MNATSTAAAIATMAGETAGMLRCGFRELLFLRREGAWLAATYIISLCHYRFAVFIVCQPVMLLKRRAFDQMRKSERRRLYVSAWVEPRTINSQSSKREPLLTV